MDNWDFKLVGAGVPGSPFGGYVSAVDRTIVGRRFMVKGSKNTYLTKRGTIANRPGLLRRGAVDATVADTKASYEWDTSLGAQRVLRVNNGKLQLETDIVTAGSYVWYDLFTVAGTRMFFEPWWDNGVKKDILLMCDGTDSMKYWSGGLGKVSSATANTIVLSAAVATQGFSVASGNVIVNGVEYAYTGSSASTLTGVTPDPSALAVNSVVTQKVETDSDTVEADFEIDFIKVINNQLYAGSESSRLLYISKNTDWDDFTKSSPRATGEGDTLTLDESPVGIGIRDGLGIAATKKAFYEVSFKQITVGSSLSEQTNVKKVPMSSKKGAIRHEFIGNDDDGELIYLSRDHQLHVYGEFADYNNVKFPSLSLDIEQELEDEDFTGGHMKVSGMFIYLTAPNNGRVWINEKRVAVNRNGNIETDRFWYAPFICNISRIAVIDDEEYGHSNANPQLYQMWNTLQWHDDAPSDEPIPYDSVLALGYRSAGEDRAHYIGFDKYYIEGYMTEGSVVYGALAFEYKGSEGVQIMILNDEEEEEEPEFFTGDIGVSLGDAALGDNPLGDQTTDEEAEQELLPKFRTIEDVEVTHVHEYQPRIYSSEPGARWEILALGGNELISEEEPVVERG